MKSKLISDTQTIVSAKGRFGHSIPVHDDGYGPLFLHRDSMGISGIVRAQTWEDAYAICEDEFFPAATETEAEFIAEYGENFTEDGAWQEAYGFRNNGRREDDGTISTIYAKDLNGDSLDMLTPALVEELEITLEIQNEAQPEPAPERYQLWHLRRIPMRGRAFLVTWSGRYGASSHVRAGGVRAQLTMHEHCAPTWETPSFNPEA